MPHDGPTVRKGASDPQNAPEDIRQKMADFIVKVEFSRQRPVADKFSIRERLREKEHAVNQHLREVKNELHHFRDLMCRAGVLQWRNEIERLAGMGKAEAEKLEESYQQTKLIITDQCEKLNRASMNTVKTVAQLVSTARSTDIKKLSTEKSIALQEVCEASTQQTGYILQSFRWRNVVLTILLTLIVSTIVSLYIDNEWPWQTHEQIVKQRDAGKVLINSWAHLNQSDQNVIIDNA